MEDPKRTDLLVVQCFCVCRGGVLLGGLVGVSGYMERELTSVLSSSRILLTVFLLRRYCILSGISLLCLSYSVFCVLYLRCSELVVSTCQDRLL